MSPLDLRDRAVLTRPVVRARYCQHLVDLLAEEGVAPEAVLEQAVREIEGALGHGAPISVRPPM